MPVQPEEAVLSGVDMETAESEDEITQIEDLKVSGYINFRNYFSTSSQFDVITWKSKQRGFTTENASKRCS